MNGGRERHKRLALIIIIIVIIMRGIIIASRPERNNVTAARWAKKVKGNRTTGCPYLLEPTGRSVDCVVLKRPTPDSGEL